MTMITVECKNCGKQVTKSMHRYNESIKNGWNLFCSRSCRYGYQEKGKKVPCAQCAKLVRKTPAQIRQTKNNIFCSKSCAATYNNTHKSRGTRRSRLEKLLEQRLKQEFASLDLRCNTTDPIGIELDFYFPKLSLAIELNGIVHYKPIYGQGKLERIQNNDREKATRCLKSGIELNVIDVSGMVSFTKKAGEHYWTIVKALVASALQKCANA